MSIEQPGADEFAPYYGTYVNKVADGDILQTLERQLSEYRSALGALAETAALYRYAPGKWSVKQVLGHVIDSERVFAYRAMRIARADSTPLPGYDENHFVANASFDKRPLTSLLEEFEHLRRSNICLFGSLSPDEAARRGTANQLAVSVRAIIYIAAGHAAHHLAVLRDKYLSKPVS
jgi:hypothetical protein